MIAQATPTPQPSPNEPIIVKISVDRTMPYGWRIDCSHPFKMTIDSIVHYLPERCRTYIERNYMGCTIDYVMQHMCPSRMTVDDAQSALAKAIAFEQSTINAEPLVMRPFDKDAYLAMGEMVYRLQPVEIARTNKALAICKRKAMKEAATVKDQLIAQANQSAKGILDEAQKRLKQAADKIAEAERSNAPPAWMLEQRRPLLFKSGMWCVSFDFNFKIDRWEYDMPHPTTALREKGIFRRKIWTASPTLPLKMRAFVPIHRDGSYQITGCYLDAFQKSLPHMHHTASCMSPATAPKEIKSQGDLLVLTDAISRCFRTVALHSLYSSPSDWEETAVKACPPALWTALTGMSWETAVRALPATEEEDVDVQVDANQTFAIDLEATAIANNVAANPTARTRRP